MLSSIAVRRARAALLRLLATGSAFVLALVAVLLAPAARADVGPTVKEVIEFTRILQPLGHDNDALQSQISPDGERAFIVTRKADVATDRNLFEILLLDVSPRRLDTGRADEPIRLLTVEARKDLDDADPAIRDARWAGNGTIVFRGRVLDEAPQVYRLDVESRRLTQMTFDAHGVIVFDVSADLRRVVYLAAVPNPAKPPADRSLVVGTNSFWSVHFGQDNLRAQQRRYRYMVAESGSRQSARSLGDAFPESSNLYPSVSVSPDGRWAMLPRYEPTRQIAWGEQYPQIAERTMKYGPSLRLDPLSYYSRPYSYIPRRFVAYRLADGAAQAVLDAPDDTLPGGSQLRNDRLWQGGGTSVVITGTFLPLGEKDASEPSAAHVVEYWPDSGKWKDIAVLRKQLTSASLVPSQPDGFVVVDGEQRRRFERTADGNWRELEEAADPAPRNGWRLRLVEALNQPPNIVASGPTGQTLRLTQLNPQYAAATWGSMRPYSWKDAKGRAWDGGLMVPADFDPKVKHALVIQTYGFSPLRFYRDGSNLFDGFTSGFAGRAFLRENILVLALPYSPSTDVPDGEHGAIAAFADGVRGAIDSLVAEGSVDRERIGIMGWSATGERVLNLVTFSDAPIRAATVLDGDANTLFSITITYAVKDGIQNRKEITNEGGPFGESLQRWIRNDPSLHTDCVKAALRIEAYGSNVQNNWDIYALLRRQYKPVEMVVIPQGAHALSRPSERMISLQGNVDWYRFWLKGEERSEPVLAKEAAATLRDQYARWNQMVPLKRAVDAAPGCVRTAGGE